MKKQTRMQKFALFVGALALTLTLSACGSKTTTEKTGATLPTATSLVKDATTAMKNQKDVHMKMATTMEQGDNQMVVSYEGNFSLQPLAMLGDYTMVNNGKGSKLKMYLNEAKFYVNTGSKWQDATSSVKTFGLSVAAFKKQMEGDTLNQLSKSVMKKGIVKTGTSEYTVTIALTADEAQALMKQSSESLSSSTTADILKDAEVKNMQFVYVISKKTKLPVELNISMKMIYSGKTFDESVTSSYSAWGSSPVTAPTI